MVPDSAPPSTLQVTPALSDCETMALNCLVSPGTRASDAGLILIWMAAGTRSTAPPPPPAHAPSQKQTLSTATCPMANGKAFVGSFMPPPSTRPIDPIRRSRRLESAPFAPALRRDDQPIESPHGL